MGRETGASPEADITIATLALKSIKPWRGRHISLSIMKCVLVVLSLNPILDSMLA
jgi:hypothetical protein